MRVKKNPNIFWDRLISFNHFCLKFSEDVFYAMLTSDAFFTKTKV